MSSRPGASNAAHANFDGGRTEPMSTATRRFPCPVIKRHIIQVRKLTEDRYSIDTNMRLPGNADVTGRLIGDR